MRFSEWCAVDPRRRPYDEVLAPTQPAHLWFGSNWQDGRGERWIVRWAPLTGEVYACNESWDVRPMGHIPTEDAFHEAWDGIRTLQSQPDSLRRLQDVLVEAPAVWDMEPTPASNLDLDP